MKIMLIGTNPFEKQASGAQVYLLQLAKELVAKKHEVSAFCGTIEKQEQAVIEINQKNINFRIIDCTKKQETIQAALRFIQEKNPDIIHVITLLRFPANFFEELTKMRQNILAELIDYWFLCPKGTFMDYNNEICRSPGIKCTACLLSSNGKKNNFLKNAARQLYKTPVLVLRKNKNIQLLNKCAMLKANSEHIKQVYEESGARPEIIKVHHKGILPEKIMETRKKTKTKKIVFGFIGTLQEIKGVHLLIEAFNSMPKSSRLLVFGDGDRAYLEIIKKMSKHPNIEFKGHYSIESIPKVLKKIDITVIPSVWEEPFGVAATNSLSFGVPVIAANTGGLKEIIQEGRNGYLFERNNPKDLLEKMLAIAENPEILNRLDRKSFRQKSIEEFAQETEKYYLEILKNKL